MKRKLALALMLVLMLLMLVPFEALAQSIVDDKAKFDTEVAANTRHSFYGEGRFWEFYLRTEDSSIAFRTSLDGTTWASEISLSINGAVGFDIWFDDPYIHMVMNTDLINYKYGEISSAGTISWGATQNTGLSSNINICPTVAVDSNDYPWIGYSNSANSQNPYAAKSSTKNGTWTTEATWNINDWKSPANTAGVRILPLTGGKMAAVVRCYYYNNIRVVRFTGVAWGASVVTTGTLPADHDPYFTAVAQDDVVHIVFLKRTSYDIVYVKYTYSTNTISAETLLYAGATSTSIPAMSMDNANNLHVFWENDPTDDHMYYAKYIYDTSTWVSYYDLIDEIDDLPAIGYYLNTDYTCDESRVGVYYIADSTILKFKLLDEVFHVDTLTASPIGDTTATLRGEIVSLGFGSATERGFWINDTPSLSGATQEGNETGTFNVGVFTHGITGLTEGDKYYYIAYASNAYGEEYGTWSQFTAGGSAGGIAVLTLDPTDVGDFEATFNGEIVSTGGDYLTMRGFQWGFSDTPTWLWDEGGNFTVGTFSYTPTDLEADSIYYVRAIAGNGTDTDYGQWVGFITEQPSYQSDEETEIGNSSLIPPLPGEPGGWIRPPKEWGNFVPGIPWTTVMWLVLTALVVLVGFALTKYAKSLAFLFIGLGFIIGVFSFFPKGGYLDWWIMFPYILVSWALISRQSERPLGE